MFSQRLIDLDNNDEDGTGWWVSWESTKPLKNMTIIILSFHVATFLLTLLESHFMSKNIWISWLTIGLAVSAIFLNASSVAVTILDDKNEGFDADTGVWPNVNASIASLVLQCMGVSLMTAYIFKIIRSKNKMTY